MSRYEDLAEKWLNGTITPEEEKEISDWFNSNTEQLDVPYTYASGIEDLRSRMLAKINERRERQRPPVRRIQFLRRIAAAAAILLVLSTGAYFLLNHNHKNAMTIAGTRYT